MRLKSTVALSILIFSVAFGCYAQSETELIKADSKGKTEFTARVNTVKKVEVNDVHGVPPVYPTNADIIAAASNTVATASNTISYLSTFFAIGTTIIVIVLTVAGIVMQLIGKKQRQHYLEEIAKVFDKNDEVKQIFVQHVIQDGEFKNLVKDAIKAAAREEAQKVLEVYEAQKAKDKVKEALGDVISE